MTRFQQMTLETLIGPVAFRTSCGVVLLWTILLAPNAYGFPYYDDGFGVGCGQSGCHQGAFDSGNSSPLHAQHRSQFGINECNLCHPSGAGSKPVATFWSGPGGGFGCAGCHGRDYGETSVTAPYAGQPKSTAYGLRQVHADLGYTFCQTSCHMPGAGIHPDPLPTIFGEDVRPPYYGTSTNNLGNPCSSEQEDLSYDADSVGLDNDGDGLADWPADLDCDEPVVTTTVPATTTTTLPVGCSVAPDPGCIAPGEGLLLVKEKTAGKEKLKVALKKLQPAITQTQFGNPLSGSTSYAICIYDDLDQLGAELSAARAGDTCGSPPKPCWASISGKGYKYGDKSTDSDGVLKMLMKGGDAGKGMVLVIGKNNASAQQTSLPTGIALLLQDNSQATVQVVTSDAECFGVTATLVKKADGSLFVGVGP